MTEKHLTIKGVRHDIPAVFTVPERTAAAPAVILIHGTGSDKNEVGNMFGRLAAALERRGIASIRFDFAGCGDSPASPLELTFKGEISDLDAVFDYARKTDAVDSRRIALLGFSQGARVAADLMGRRGDEIPAAVFWSGACQQGVHDIFETWRDTYYADAVKNGYAVLPSTWRDDLWLTKDWFDEIRASRPLDYLARYKGALLAIAGELDDLVPFAHAAEIAAAVGGGDASSFVFKGVGHTYNAGTGQNDLSEQVIAMTADWLAERLKGKENE